MTVSKRSRSLKDMVKRSKKPARPSRLKPTRRASENPAGALNSTPAKRTLIGAVNDTCALAALRAFEEAGRGEFCAVVGQNAIRDARRELHRPGTRLIGTVAYFPERYGDELISLSLGILQKKLSPAAVFVKHQLVTPKNVKLIYPLDE